MQEAKKKTKGSSKGRGRPRKKGPQEQVAYHFIAYVPLEGKVWQLDGLQCYPTCLGNAPSRHQDGNDADMPQGLSKETGQSRRGRS